MKIPKHIESIARSIASAHGSHMVMNKDGQNLTVAALAGYGSWGHSSEKYAEAKWHQYVGAAWSVVEVPPFMPPHKGSCTISHNDHLNNYATVEQEEEFHAEWFKGSWVSGESREFAIKNNQLWSIQWYPETPVGFSNLCAGRWADIVAHLYLQEQSA